MLNVCFVASRTFWRLFTIRNFSRSVSLGGGRCYRILYQHFPIFHACWNYFATLTRPHSYAVATQTTVECVHHFRMMFSLPCTAHIPFRPVDVCLSIR